MSESVKSIKNNFHIKNHKRLSIKTVQNITYSKSKRIKKHNKTLTTLKITNVIEKIFEIESKSHNVNEGDTIAREEERGETCVVEMTQSAKHYNEQSQPSNVTSNNVFSVNKKRLNGGESFLRKNKTDTSKRQLTLMLIFLPIFYLLTTLPVFTVILVETISSKYGSGTNKANISGYIDLAFNLARALMFTNHSLNVVLFILIGGQ